MDRIIGIASGTIWRWTDSINRNKLLDYCQKLDVQGIEITTASKEELFNLKISDANIKWIKSLKYVSIHAPFKLVSRSADETEIIKQLEMIQKFYRLLNAKTIVIHPDQLPEKRILKKFKMNISIENMENRQPYNRIDMDKILRSNPELGLCLDISHAYTHSKDEANNLIKKYNKRITQAHFSGTYRKKRHQSLQIVTKSFIDSLSELKKTDIPLIIEEDFKEKSIKSLKKEISYIHGLDI